MASLYRTFTLGVWDFIDTEGRVFHVWEQGLVTQTVIARCGGASSEVRWMREDLTDLCMNFVARIDGDPVVRRGVALALGSVVDGWEMKYIRI